MEFKVGDKATSKINDLVYEVTEAEKGSVTFRYEDAHIAQNITLPVELANQHFTRLNLEGCERDECEYVGVTASEWNELHHKLNILDERIAHLYDELDEVTNAFQNVLDSIGDY